jgi:hypothetical protein
MYCLPFAAPTNPLWHCLIYNPFIDLMVTLLIIYTNVNPVHNAPVGLSPPVPPPRAFWTVISFLGSGFQDLDKQTHRQIDRHHVSFCI